MSNWRTRLLIGSALALAASAQSAFAQTASPAAPADDIIVTGTRTVGLTQAESLTPIKVLGAEALEAVGQPNLNQALTQLVPSYTAQAFGGDTANLTLSAKLRGLSPNHTLVLVNGKRRHGSANLAVLQGAFQGGAAPDLDFISPVSIKRVEILQEGAAAQYGSDAIAGVVNIILKDDAQGGSAAATAGEYFDTGGLTHALTGNVGFKIGDNGFLNVSVLSRFQDYTQVGGTDRRVTDPSGALLTTLSAAQRALYANIPGFPFVNKINGNARSRLLNVGYNSGYDFANGVSLYSFGTHSERIASSFQNLRVPDRIISSGTPGVAGVLGAPGAIVFDPQGDNPPNGFSPREGIRQDDYSLTNGVKGEIGGATFDLSATWGQDKVEVYTLDSANRSLFIDKLFTPINFYNGSFTNTEWTINADFTKELDLGLAAPVSLAWGAEYRDNQYEIGSGDPASIYKEGGQSYPGFRPSDAGGHSRNATSVYADLGIEPVKDLKVDAAVRYENYSDFGSKTIWKVAGRYDFSDAVGVRGTISTGFRAPTLAESFYSATNVSPTAAFVQLPANSAAAKLIGFQNLKPETSENASVGVVLRPADRLTVTVDAFQVKVKDRILGTGSIFGSGGAVNFPIVTSAIVANGNVLDPTVSQTGINIFTNGADTRTQGVDVIASYRSEFGATDVNWTLSGTWNETKLTSLRAAPAALGTLPLFDQTTVSFLTTASPKFKVVAGADVAHGPFDGTIRAAWYGESKARFSPNGGTFYEQKVPSALIIDVEGGVKVREWAKVSIGANNLFNERPPTIARVPGTSTIVNGGNVFDAPLTFSPYGINGGYYYGRIAVTF